MNFWVKGGGERENERETYEFGALRGKTGSSKDNRGFKQQQKKKKTRTQ